MNIGGRLKEERVAKGISLDDLQDSTKIQKRYLQAIEEGDLQILPGKFYAKAFIKEYAQSVGLDPNELLEEHKGEIPEPEEESEVKYSRIERLRKENGNDKNATIFSLLPTAIIILIIIAIGFVIWYFIQQVIFDGGAEPVEETANNEVIINDPDQTDGAGTDSVSEDAQDTDQNGADNIEDDNQEDTEENADGGSEELTVLDEDTSGSTPETVFALNNPEDEVTMTLESADDTWLEIEGASGESLYYGSLTTEESPLEIDITDEDRVQFTIGNTPDLTITVNGMELEYPIDPEEEIVQQIELNINNEES